MAVFKNIIIINFYKLILLLIILFFHGCKTPIYENVEVINDKKTINQTVQFSIDKNFYPNKINCITVGKILDYSDKKDYNKINKSRSLRNSILGMLNSKSYEIVRLPRVDYLTNKNPNIKIPELLDNINCDAILTGKILKFQNKFYVSYSVTTVEIYLELTDSLNNKLWSAKHAANSREGAIPLTPISLLTGLIVATSNKQDEVAYQMIDTVSRRIISTLPDKIKLEYSEESFGVLGFEKTSILDTIITEKLNTENTPQNLLIKGAYEEALILSKTLIKNNSNNSENYYFASTAELLLKNYSSSINYALTAISKEYLNEEVYSTLGIAYLNNGNGKMAEAAFQKGLTINPNSSLINYNIALLKEIQSDWKTSAQQYFKTGTLCIDEKNNIRLYKSLKSLKRLSDKNVYANKLYIKLGIKVSNLLKAS